MNEVIYDADGDPVGIQRPSWTFSWWDMAGVASFLIGGVFKTVGQGLDMLGREFSAAANNERDRQAQAEHVFWQERMQAAADRETREILGIPVARDEDIPEAER